MTTHAEALAKTLALDPLAKKIEPVKFPPTSTRGDWQIAIENNICWLNPDALEAHDMLGAFKKSLTDRYGDEAQDALEAFTEVQEALEELDRTYCGGGVSKQDFAEYEADRSRNDDDWKDA